MRSRHEIEEVLRLADSGLNSCQIARQTGLPRTTIRDWRSGKTPGRPRSPSDPRCGECGHPIHAFDRLHPAGYSYLLGMYLGDGYIAANRRGVYRLTIACDLRYPQILEEVARTMLSFTPSRHVSVQRFPSGSRGRVGWVNAYSKAWPCLFPQHGPGRKHTRRIVLAPWQEQLVGTAPDSLLRGLIHSDGSRFLNRVGGAGRTYAYPRYNFTNASEDIRRIFCDACDALGISWRRMNERNISVARRDAVARLDEFVGPKA
jgi:hypothetical protein